MELIAQIKALQHQRREHEIAIRAIDEQLAEARNALGLGAPVVTREPIPRKARLWTGEGSGTEDLILNALAQGEPASAAEIMRLCQGLSTVRQILPRMIERGVIFSRQVGGGTKTVRLLYARTAEALDRQRADEEAAEAIEAEAG